MLKEKAKRNKVVVAMSGGVDSSVAAALLEKQDYDVIGIFLRFWKGPGAGENRCCSTESEKRARKVAKILKIPFYVFNFEKEFKKRIVDYFLDEYKKGITPNPCVVCNKEIKFGLLLEKALALDADYIATGHYARTNLDWKNLTKNPPGEKVKFRLFRGKDKNKDQSYFLWMLNQKQLSRILFPIGDYTREEVEKLAKKFKLPVLKARKSVEICFIRTTINDFLKKYLKAKPGQIVDIQGKALGKHDGLYFYTIGQRKGLGLVGGPAFAKATAGKPYYVLDKDLKKNLLIVTKNEKDLLKKELICKNVNWISGKEPKLPLKIKAKIRYRHQPTTATITKILNSKFYILKFARPQRAITSGQSVVFYKGQEVLGGGIIKNKEILC
jgi:tRNA-specific 2-thiouridylase